MIQRLLLLVVSSAIAIGIAEYACRQLIGERLAVATDERNLLYRYDATLGWFPDPNTEREFTGERTIHVRHNSLGIRDVEIPPKAPGRPRIAFFGDSVVWGYDAEASERFSDLIRQGRPGWDIANCGVSGYGTDQALLLMERMIPVLHPDAVVLVFNKSDRSDNMLSENHGGYAKPIFAIENGALELANVPVPLNAKSRWSESALYRQSFLWRMLVQTAAAPKIAVYEDPSERIVDRMNDEAAAAGARLVIALAGPDEQMLAHAREREIPVVETEQALLAAATPDVPTRYTGHGAHLTPAGHKIVASLLEPVLEKALKTPALAE